MFLFSNTLSNSIPVLIKFFIRKTNHDRFLVYSFAKCQYNIETGEPVSKEKANNKWRRIRTDSEMLFGKLPISHTRARSEAITQEAIEQGERTFLHYPGFT